MRMMTMSRPSESEKHALPTKCCALWNLWPQTLSSSGSFMIPDWKCIEAYFRSDGRQSWSGGGGCRCCYRLMKTRTMKIIIIKEISNLPTCFNTIKYYFYSLTTCLCSFIHGSEGFAGYYRFEALACSTQILNPTQVPLMAYLLCINIDRLNQTALGTEWAIWFENKELSMSFEAMRVFELKLPYI